MKNEIETMLNDSLGSHCGLNADWCVMAWEIHRTPMCNILRVQFGWYIMDAEEQDEYHLIVRTTTDNGHEDQCLAISDATVEDVAAMVAEATECLRKTGMLPTPTIG